MRTMIIGWAASAMLLALPMTAAGQAKIRVLGNPATTVPLSGVGYGGVGADAIAVDAAHPLPVATNGRQESYSLAAGNTSSATQTIYGGGYVFSQSCTSYGGGGLTLRYRGPDGATMMTLLTKTASDSAGGTLVSLASNAVVDVALPSGSTGCNATLARVP